MRTWYLLTAIVLVWYMVDVARSDSGSGSTEIDEEETASGRSTMAAASSPVSDSQKKSKEVTFTEIVSSSLSLITGKLEDPIKLRKFLNKHFFTGDKAMSIWSKAIDETEELYTFDFQERDLADIQTVLRKIYQNILDCDSALQKSKRKQIDLQVHSQCYVAIYDIISNAKIQFGFPPGSDVGKARILSLNIAYNMMRLLFLQMTQNLAMKADLNPLRITKPIIDTAVELTNYYTRAERAANVTRFSAVGPVKVCTQVTIFFKDFDDHCSPESAPYDDLQISGGSSRPVFQKKVKVSVTDNTNGEVICEVQQIIIKESSLSKMQEKCEKARASYMNKLEKEMAKYFAERTQSITKALPLLWGRSKKKLKMFADKIGLNIN